MKKSINSLTAFCLLLSAFCIMTMHSAMAQDVITLKSGTDINAFVQDIGDVEVKYKKFDNPKGPNYTLKKSEILMIRYENGTKDIFSEETKPVEEVIVVEEAGMKNYENMETVFLPENMQSRNDVIVRVGYGFGHAGFQAKIMHTDYKHIFYKKFKQSGKEKDKKIKQKRVAYTLSFNEAVKQEIYPLRMSVQEFQSLPIYFGKNHAWTVFGTNGLSNLAHVRKIYPEIYDDFIKGQKLCNTAITLSTLSIIFAPFGGIFNPIWWAFYIPSSILSNRGSAKISNSATNYYSTCVNLEILDRYGITITPYRTNPFTIQVK